jgi:chemotaxis protein CheC
MMQLDVLRELINMGIGQAAGMLNQLTRSHVELSVPKVQLLKVGQLMNQKEYNADAVITAVRLGFDGLFSGLSVLMFSPGNADKLVALMLGEEPKGKDMDMLRSGALQEVGNIVLNGVMGSIANVMQGGINYLPPDHFEVRFRDLLLHHANKDDSVLFAQASFMLEKHVIDGQVAIVFEMDSFDSLLGAIDAMIDAS